MNEPHFFDEQLIARATALVHLYAGLGLTIATAESCTGGLIAALLTEVPGSSAVVEAGFVTYSNRAKEHALGVSKDLLATHGAVSEPVARAMAQGALRASHAHVAVATTGIAGQGGGTADKPVGLVFLACAARGAEAVEVSETVIASEHRFGQLDRAGVRRATVVAALDLLEAQTR